MNASQRSTLLAVCMAAACCSPPSTSPVVHAAPPSDPLPHTSATRSPMGPIPFGIYSPDPADFRELAALGFNTVGPWYKPARAAAGLAEAERLGLAVIYPVGYAHARYKAERTIEWTEAETTAALSAQVTALAGHTSIVAWYLFPEELHETDPVHVGFLRAATAAIRAADPQGRPILSYQANRRTAQRLAPVVAHTDIAIKGSYANFAGHRDTRAWVRWSVDEIQAAGGNPVWLVPEMFQEPETATPATIAAWVRHDVYAGLAAGARGVLVFSGWRRPNFPSYATYLRAYGDVAEELHGPLQLAEVFEHGFPATPRAVALKQGEPYVEFAVNGEKMRFDAVARVDRHHSGRLWSLLVNSSARSLVLDIAIHDDVAVAAASAGARLDGTTLQLPAWGMVMLHDRPAR